MQLLPYFSYSSINILFSSCVHLSSFLLLFGKLAGASFPQSKEAGKKTNCNDKQLLYPAANGMIDRQNMNNKKQVITNNKH
jgi:hypothetical protein